MFFCSVGWFVTGVSKYLMVPGIKGVLREVEILRTWATLRHTHREETKRKMVIISSWKIDDGRIETTLQCTVYDYLWYWRWFWKVSKIL